MAKEMRVHPFIIIALFLSALFMGILTYDNFIKDNLAFAYISLFLCTMLVTMAFTGISKNRKKDE